MQIKTAGELRSFLADVLVGIKEGTITPTQAQAMSKIAAQINQSLVVEVNTALQLERMGQDKPVAGSMLIGQAEEKVEEPLAIEDCVEEELADEPEDEGVVPEISFTERVTADSPVVEAAVEVFGEEAVTLPFVKEHDRFRTDLIWCEQCDGQVAPEDAAGCRSRFCSLRQTVIA